jgi:D-lactate dehydrogenase
MKIALFSAKPYTKRFFEEANSAHHFDINYIDATLCRETCALAEGFDAVCAFVNDHLDGPTIERLAAMGVRLVALRCAGFNNVDLEVAAKAGIAVVRVPAYSPHAVAEHTLTLMLALNRKITRAHNRVREGNFELEGLLGFDLFGRKAGVIGTGQIGTCVAKILLGFGCDVVAYDKYENEDLKASGVQYVDLDTLYGAADIITLHCPLMPETHHLINLRALEKMKPGVMLINTSRGALIKTEDIIVGLKSGVIGYLGIDVYEEEDALFFSDLSSQVIQDDVFARLLTFPNVLITGHQAFFTREAFVQIAETTLANVKEFQDTGTCKNTVRPSPK